MSRYSHQCSGWTGVVNYEGYTHCMRREGDPEAVNWTTTSATVPGSMNLQASLVVTVNGQFPSHSPPVLALDHKTGFTCPGSFSY